MLLRNDNIMKTTLLRLPLKLYEQISQLAEEQKRSTNSQIVFILDEYMKECCKEGTEYQNN